MPATWIKIEDIEDGMVLAGAIEDEMGRVLLREGHELVKSYVGRLQKMGVNEVLIDLKDGESSDVHPAVGAKSSDTEKRRRTKSKLSRRFKPHKQDSIMRMIHAVALRKLLRGMEFGE